MAERERFIDLYKSMSCGNDPRSMIPSVSYLSYCKVLLGNLRKGSELVVTLTTQLTGKAVMP